MNKSALGITQNTAFDYFPSISPKFTLFCVLLALAPLVIKIWKLPRRRHFPLYLSYAVLSFFFFGFQVHEKAILMVTVIYTSVSMNDPESLRISTMLRITSAISQFPILPRINGIPALTKNLESPLKYTIFLVDLSIHVLIVMRSRMSMEGKQKIAVYAAMGAAIAFLLGSVYWVNLIMLK